MTLIEIMVGIFLYSLLLGLVMAIFIPSQRYLNITDMKSEVQLNAQAAINRIKMDVFTTNYRSFTNNTAGEIPAISFQTSYNDEGIFVTDYYGYPLWQKYIIYYLHGASRTIKRKTIPGGQNISPLSPEALSAACDGTGKIVAFDASNFTAVVDPVSETFTVTVTTEALAQGKKNTNQLSGILYAPNWRD
jgi:type II secretory pathway pseudopilin PulG